MKNDLGFRALNQQFLMLFPCIPCQTSSLHSNVVLGSLRCLNRCQNFILKGVFVVKENQPISIHFEPCVLGVHHLTLTSLIGLLFGKDGSRTPACTRYCPYRQITIWSLTFQNDFDPFQSFTFLLHPIDSQHSLIIYMQHESDFKSLRFSPGILNFIFHSFCSITSFCIEFPMTSEINIELSHNPSK